MDLSLASNEGWASMSAWVNVDSLTAFNIQNASQKLIREPGGEIITMRSLMDFRHSRTFCFQHLFG